MDYSRRVDNHYLPNTKEGNDKFCWWLHWFGGHDQFIILIHLINLEKQYKKMLNKVIPATNTKTDRIEELKAVLLQSGIVLSEKEISYLEKVTGSETGPYTAEFSAL
jgi:hypothetical protein